MSLADRGVAARSARRPEPRASRAIDPRRRRSRATCRAATAGGYCPGCANLRAISSAFLAKPLPSATFCRIDLAGQDFDALFGHGGEQLVGGVGEQFDAVVDELVGHAVERDAGAGKRVQLLLAPRPDFPPGCCAICRGRGTRPWSGRHGIDGVRADQLFDIEHVAIGLVLGAGRSPEQPLRLGAARPRAPPSARRRTVSDSADRRAWHWRWRPCL